jgi:hypothetical protein
MALPEKNNYVPWDELNPTDNEILPFMEEVAVDEYIDANGGITAEGYELLAQMDADGDFV